ncbi:Miniconductance mechanosensitive channel YbdG [Roseovarius litorisediminis]|uniref:Miniconductance mechanosensitive channel YbdG n=1 Tax=Roseovarius litorisediminis TaxID=1312363 RepID=A0A1Y5TSG3_9RHOB|nr:mechanosensitive ion channel domain-containing protein [Roseovarius litorisediminis]SLN70880.1 Miniconductance mechanosensitive channel YbdG [Roseovarius litorisediminis]
MSFIQENPQVSFIVIVAIALAASPFLQRLIGRVAFRIAIRTETVIDDLIVDALRPFRFVYAIPTALAYFLADWLAPYAYEVRVLSGLVSIFLAVETALKVMSALASIIRHRSGAKGVSSTGYIDILKILTVLVGIVAAGSVVVDTDLITLIGGVGAATAVLGLIFKDSLHSIFASIKIASWNLIREGDWLVVPSFGADGTVEHIGLYDIKVRNWDLTTVLVPTHSVLEVANANYTSMQDTRARRLFETFSFDVGSVRVCDRALLERLQGVPLISDIVAEKIEALGDSDEPGTDARLAPVITTNFEIFCAYVDRYLRSREDIHQKRHYIMIRTTAPTHHGIPMEIFAFLREVSLVPFSKIQTDIFNHLLAMIGVFDLRLHQSLAKE